MPHLQSVRSGEETRDVLHITRVYGRCLDLDERPPSGGSGSGSSRMARTEGGPNLLKRKAFTLQRYQDIHDKYADAPDEDLCL